MSQITSNAFNFSDYISSGVDPRTGMYNVSINLGAFFSHRTSGHALMLKLSYDAASSNDAGFGRGWGVQLSRYARETRTLSLSTGQSFRIFYNALLGEYDIPYRKLKDIRVFHLSATNELKVVHKDGRVEFIDHDTGILTKTVSHHGLVLFFDYISYRNFPALSRIYDNAGQEVLIDWRTHEWKTIIEHKINNQLVAKIECDKNSSPQRLNSIKFSGQNNLTLFKYFFSSSTGYDLIEQTTHSSGLIEELTYRENGHALPQNAPISNVPNVSRYRRVAGDNQPDMIVEYEFSDRNYLGFGSDRNWIAGEDTLFKARSDYRYNCTETINGSLSIYRVYNKYHLMETAEYRKDGKLYKREDNTYFADLNRGIESQPAIYAFLETQNHTYHYNGNSRTFSSAYDYDDYGNQVYVKHPDGSVIERIFFPPAGSEGRCPPAPNGIVSLLDTETHHPSTGHNEKSRHIRMSYIQLPRLARENTGYDYFVLLNEQQLPDKTIQFSYYDDTNQPFHYGRLKHEWVDVNGHVQGTEMGYEFSDNALVTSSTLTTHDGLTINASETVRYQDGQVIRKKNAEGIVSSFDYDELGRMTKETFAPDSEYEAITHYEYRIGKSINNIITTDPKGNKQVQHFNNAGKLIRFEISDAQGILREVKRSEYDAFGLLVTQHETDYLHNSIPLTLTTTFEYNEHGEISKIVHPDGRVELIEQDLAALVTRYHIPGLMTIHTRYNLAGQEVYQNTQDNDGDTLAETKYEYDGFGNLISTEDTHGRITRMSYDNSDRMYRVERTVGGKLLSQEVRYANFTTDVLVSRVLVNGINLGHREYDGLGRLLSEQSSASGTTDFRYSGPSLMPIQENTPQGNINMVNDAHLNVMIKRSSEQKISNYVHDKISGQLLEDDNEHAQQIRQYNRLGQLILNGVQYSDGVQKKASYSYSLLGNILREKDYFGMETIYHYDELGRVKNVVTENNRTTLSYDSFSRPVRFETLDGTNRAEIELTFNALGLEGFRRVILNGIEAFTLEQVFNQDLQIVEKIYNEQGNITVERMAYDDLLRLVEYTCDGSNRPRDELGHAILKQQFSYDLFGNITVVKSDFVDNNGIADTNLARYFYDSKSLVRLIGIMNSHHLYPQELTFDYDAAGNLLLDDQGREYHYNELGQMVKVANREKILSEYHYSATDDVVSQSNETVLLRLYYQGDALVNEMCNGLSSHYHGIRGGATSRIVRNQHDRADVQQLLIPNSQGSVIASAENNGEYTTRQYTAYGQG